MRIGIFGGSFNPVHEGHLALARFAYSELNLEKLYFVPSYETPLKVKKELLPADFRLKLLKKAIKACPEFSISTCEMDRQGKSYTIDTLRYFQKKSGKNAKIFFLTGMDSLENLSRWKSVDQIFKLCRFVVATRPGYAPQHTKFPVLWMPFEALDVSSRRIRRHIEARESIKGLVPQGIIKDLSRKGDPTSTRRKR